MAAKKKCNATADTFRKTGNKRFAKDDFFGALANYNDSLRYAERNSHQLGLCYGNRSAVFLKVKQYQACLENIELARKNQFPDELLPKLRDREIKCKQLMDASAEPLEDTWNKFFALSYPANPNFPYLANCLELKKQKDGWFLATNIDLKAGDIIAITEPFVKFPTDTSSYRCNYCLSDKFMNYIPCSGCVEVMFCSDSCMDKAMKEFHQFECGFDKLNAELLLFYTMRMIVKCYSLFDGNRREMQKFIASNEKYMSGALLTPFDFDLSDPTTLASQKNLMLTQICVNRQHKRDMFCECKSFVMRPFLDRHPKLKAFVTPNMFVKAIGYASGDRKRFKAVGGKQLSSENQDLMDKGFINYFGDAIDPCFNIIRYSCAPNIILHAYNGKIVWIVHYPIKANELLTCAFKNTVFFETSLSERLESDLFDVVKKCKCAACTAKWDRVFATIITPIYIMRYSSDVAIEKMMEYCDEINKSAKPLAKKCNDDVWLAVSRLRWNISNIGKASFWDPLKPMFDINDMPPGFMNFLAN